MSLRFILLYLSCLIATTLYFMNMPPTGKDLSLSEYILAKCINQSQSLLLGSYLTIKYYGKYNRIINLLIAIFVSYLMCDIINLFSQNKLFLDIANNIFAIIYRILFSIIFVIEGSKFSKITYSKLSLLIAFYLLTFGVYYSIFNEITLSIQIISIFSAIIYLSFLWLCANRPVNPRNAWLALIAATICVFTDFNYLFHSYIHIVNFTFSWMRTLSSIADLVLVWAILSNANLMPSRLKIE